MYFNKLININAYVRVHYVMDVNKVIRITDSGDRIHCTGDQIIYNDKVTLDQIKRILNAR